MGLVQGLGWLLAVVRLRGPLRAPMRDLQGFIQWFSVYKTANPTLRMYETHLRGRPKP